ncbi:MAG: DUF5671 domain-containing protein [bacterium]|nr:DUF5671 domain-containing protein [bacterium]
MEPKPSNTVRDIFLHLLSIIALYLVSFAFGRLLFSIVNVYFPDLLGYNGDEYGSLRFAIASIIVVFPVYFFVTRFLVRERAKPEYQDVRLRRWIVYLTLFLAAIVIITDLVTLLYTLLDGEMTARFILKVLAVLVIAAAVFYYYLWELKARVPAIRIFVGGTIVVVFAGVVLGFFLIGSPSHRRAVRFDERRTQDLQSVQYEVVNYWQSKEKLPETLDGLKDQIRGFAPPVDPVTGVTYDYRVLAPLQFELCATFTTDVNNTPSPIETKPYPVMRGGYSENWQHGIGKGCFTRTIDPQLYPPIDRKNPKF